MFERADVSPQAIARVLVHWLYGLYPHRAALLSLVEVRFGFPADWDHAAVMEGRRRVVFQDYYPGYNHMARCSLASCCWGLEGAGVTHMYRKVI